MKIQSAAGPAYGCFVNVKIDGAWKYWSIVLDYPKDVINKADGKRVKANLRVYKPGTHKLTRLANCIIPATDRAHQMLQKLMMKGVQNIEVVSPRKMSKDGETISGCKVYEDGYWCPENSCFTKEGNCQDQGDGSLSLPIIVVEGGGGDGDDGSSGDDPNDPPSPPGGGTGGDGPGGGGPCRTCGPGDDPCGSNQKDKPDECEQEEQSEPCDTGNPVLDDFGFQVAMENLWEDQKSSGEEQAGFAYPNGYGGYAFNRLADHLIQDRSATEIEFYLPSNIPEGAIYVHTHPTRTVANAFGISFENYHRVSDYDYEAISKMENVEKGFVLDEGKIIAYNSEGILEMNDRCGY